MSKPAALPFSLLLLTAATARAQAPDTAALKRGYTLFCPVPKELLRDFTPDRPGISQSAHTVDAGHFQLETDLFRRHSAAQTKLVW